MQLEHLSLHPSRSMSEVNSDVLTSCKTLSAGKRGGVDEERLNFSFP